MKNKIKDKKAITLVALVVTIIILLILAGITINTLMNNGLFEKAKEAKNKWQNAQDEEETQIAKYTNEIESQVNGNRGTVTLTEEEYEIFKNQTTYLANNDKVIGKWINGENLYRVVINGGAISSGSYIDLSSYNIDTLVYYYVMFSNANDDLAVSSAYKDPWCNLFVTYNRASSKLNVNYSDFTPTNSVFTIEFTKKATTP